MNHDEPNSRLQQRQALCALLDGDLSEADLACRAWREDPQSRADWHAYHLIAEVMRSEAVRCAPRHDARFLGLLRERLAVEPVVLSPGAPAGSASKSGWRRAWAVPMAVAASFIVVAGVLVVTRVAAPDGALGDLSAGMESSVAVPGARGAHAAAAESSAAAAPVSAGAGVLIRSAELDRYLAAHKQYSSTSALAAPGGAVRNVGAVAPGP